MKATFNTNKANRIIARKEYNSILRDITWEGLKEVPNSKKSSLNSLNSFLESHIFEMKKIKSKTKKGDLTQIEWSVRPQSVVVYMCILDVDETKVPVEFKKLYTTVRDWNLERQT